MNKFVIKKEDLEWEFFRCGGKGGQKVNKTSSGARVRHVPTGFVGESRVERSQSQNRRRALVILVEKIMGSLLGKQEEAKSAAYREKANVSFGEQTRTYVLCDKKRVVDHITGVKTSDVESVLNGGLDEFIEASMRSRI